VSDYVISATNAIHEELMNTKSWSRRFINLWR
jgi:hypothetical protein